MRLIHSLVLLLVLGAFCVHSPIVAQDATKDDAKPEPREFTEAEIKAADELRLTLSTDQQTLYNGLRYLLRPEFEVELMKGRNYRPCTLEPFETRSETPLTTLELLRLWAVVQSGMPATGALDSQLQRFLNTPLPPHKDSLAHVGTMVLIARAAINREGFGRAEDLKLRATTLLTEANKLTDPTSERSDLVTREAISPTWFANHMWRALMMRAALDMGIEIDDKLWERDIKTLCDAWRKDLGWTSTRDSKGNVIHDLHCNLMALTALGLATNLPEKTVGGSAEKAVEKKLKLVPELLTRLDADFAAEPMRGSRLLMLMSLAPTFAPERTTAATWREDNLRTGVAKLEPSGAIHSRDTMAADMGMSAHTAYRGETTACETALTCLACSGGLYATGKAPLAGRELSGIGRVLYSLAILHAEKARFSSGDFGTLVNIAIEDGCDYLSRLQKDDGSFAGAFEMYPGNTALCLLAMMHGGWRVEQEAIKRGIAWLTENSFKGICRTYDVACILMCFQKFYESAQNESRILYVNTPEEFAEARTKVWKLISDPHRKLIEKLVAFLNGAHNGGDLGGWGYNQTGGPGNNRSDNSCSQYAMLGYKAASLLGAEFNPSILHEEAERLIRQYNPSEGSAEVEYEHEPDEREEGSKSTKSVYRDTIKPGGWSYSTGSAGQSIQMTAAGISSLTIAMDELKVRGKLKRHLAEKLGLTVRGSEAYVHAHYYTPEDFQGARNLLQMRMSDGHGIFYNLYSIERACVLAGIRKLEGETDWYQIGAEALIENQNIDGGWGVDLGARIAQDMRQVVNTCYAILFLKQASMPVITEHKKREKEREEREKNPEEKPKDPITGK